MLSFIHEKYTPLVFSLSCLILVFYFILYWRKGAWLKTFGQKTYIQKFSKIPSIYRNLIKGTSISAACCILGLTLLQPKWQTTEEQYEKEGLEIVFVLDVSMSMLAEDVKPNRLECAKIEIANLVRGLEDDRVGLVVFAARAFSLLPYPTKDYEMVFLRILNMVNEHYVRFVPYGTNIGNALIAAMETFSNEAGKKIIILLTDGEEQLLRRSQVVEAIRLLLEKNDISTYIIGIGDPNNSTPIPKRDKLGNKSGYERTEDGEIIYTKPDPKLLREIAEMAGGSYQHDATGAELQNIFKQVIETNKDIIGVKKKNIIYDISQYFLGCALILLALYFIL